MISAKSILFADILFSIKTYTIVGVIMNNDIIIDDKYLDIIIRLCDNGLVNSTSMFPLSVSELNKFIVIAGINIINIRGDILKKDSRDARLLFRIFESLLNTQISRLLHNKNNITTIYIE